MTAENSMGDERLRSIAATAKAAGIGTVEKAQLAYCRSRVEVAGGDLLAFDRSALRIAAGAGTRADWISIYRQAGWKVAE